MKLNGMVILNNVKIKIDYLNNQMFIVFIANTGNEIGGAQLSLVISRVHVNSDLVGFEHPLVKVTGESPFL